MKKIRVTVWNEFYHERKAEHVRAIYPEGIHGFVKGFLDANDDMEVRAVSLYDPDNGLPDEVLNNTDVLMWWGHVKHHEVPDELVEKIRQRVYRDGMGMVFMHSGHHSKAFRAILGCTGNLAWGDNMPAVVWNMMPTHPIAQGIPACFDLECEELYSEPFFVPKPEDLIFASWYPNGNLFRSGMTYRRGQGKIFYFQPGHEECKSFYNPYVQRILTNGIRWVNPGEITVPEESPYVDCGYIKTNKENAEEEK